MQAIENILAPTHKTIAALKPLNDPITPTGSWLLGIPYMPRDFKLPPASHTGSWHCFAQLNFADLPPGIDPDLPNEGLMSFFFDASQLYGLDFNAMGVNGVGYLAVFHPHPDLSLHDPLAAAAYAPIPDLENPTLMDPDAYPVTTPTTFGFDLETQPLLPTDQAHTSRHPDISDAIHHLDSDPDVAMEAWYEHYSPTHSYSQVGGYAYFTQDDPRTTDDWVMLLQLDSDGRFNMMWGDSGIGSFSIPREALKKRDFSQVYFTWDCC